MQAANDHHTHLTSARRWAGQQLRPLLGWLDLREYRPGALRSDLVAGLTVTFLSVPQAVAYAMVAGLPPAMGLYAAAVPTIVGSLFRSSRHVLTGPSNALSLLAGSVIAAANVDSPVQAAVTLAAMVGAMQLLAGMLRLGTLVDYISSPVVLGYITGAAVLIAAGQLENVTGTAARGGDLLTQLQTWWQGLAAVRWGAVALAVGTFALVLLLRRLDRRIPSAVLVVGAATALAAALDLGAHGITLVRDIAPIPAGLPPLTEPSLGQVNVLWSGAVACTVLSLVESSSVARSLASQSGQRLDASTEFAGQGLANLAGGFFGGYPTSGSLTRSALNAQAGARSRLAGVFSGALMLVVLLFLGPALNYTPIPALAGLIFVVAVDLIDVGRIKTTLRATRGDAAAFLATTVGTWIFPLDTAIELGIGISIILFLRRARLLVVRDMVVDTDGRLRESALGEAPPSQYCSAIRIVHVEGTLFFGASGELQNALDEVVRDVNVKVLVIRLKRTQGMDITTARVLDRIATQLQSEGRHVILAGMRPRTMALLERTGLSERVGGANLFPTEPQWFSAMEKAMRRALELAGDHACGEHCPVAEHVENVARASD